MIEQYKKNAHRKTMLLKHSSGQFSIIQQELGDAIQHLELMKDTLSKFNKQKSEALLAKQDYLISQNICPIRLAGFGANLKRIETEIANAQEAIAEKHALIADLQKQFVGANRQKDYDQKALKTTINHLSTYIEKKEDELVMENNNRRMERKF